MTINDNDINLDDNDDDDYYYELKSVRIRYSTLKLNCMN